MRLQRSSWWWLSGWLVSCACGGEDRVTLDPGQTETLAEQASDAFYDFEHRVEVEIELSPADWQALRNDGRSLAQVFDPSLPFEYTSFVGSVSIDGERYEQVQVRKKGFLGSLSMLAPALKLDLGETISGQSHRGVRRLTLNNDMQDPSHTHTCLAYRAFARAGLAASRCNLAHVSVNGEDLGTYSNVEPVDKRLLRRHFASDEGNLYEAQAADVLDPMNPRLQAKTNEAANDRSDLAALAAALEAEDGELVASLESQLDLEQFRTFWAAETLLGHWDGYSGNTNNYFIYRDPTSQRFSFLPWGTDSAFEGLNPFDTANRDVSVYAAGRIANRLYALPAERELFRARLGELAESVWDEAVLLGEVDQVEALAPDASPFGLAAQRQHIASHREVLSAALAEPARDWDDSGGFFASPCRRMGSEVTGRFETRFGALDAPAPGGELELSIDGVPVSFDWLLLRAGEDATSGRSDTHVRYLAPLPDGRFLVADFSIPRSLFNVGEHPFQGVETHGIVGVLRGESRTLVGIIGDGAITLREAGASDGAPVTGEITGGWRQFQCADL